MSAEFCCLKADDFVSIFFNECSNFERYIIESSSFDYDIWITSQASRNCLVLTGYQAISWSNADSDICFLGELKS